MLNNNGGLLKQLKLKNTPGVRLLGKNLVKKERKIVKKPRMFQLLCFRLVNSKY